jgi:hypothetical protein
VLLVVDYGVDGNEQNRHAATEGCLWYFYCTIESKIEWIEFGFGEDGLETKFDVIWFDLISPSYLRRNGYELSVVDKLAATHDRLSQLSQNTMDCPCEGSVAVWQSGLPMQQGKVCDFRADDKWHGISRILAYSTSFGWNILLRWHGIESCLSVEYSNIPLLSIPYVAVAGSSYGSKLTNPI